MASTSPSDSESPQVYNKQKKRGTAQFSGLHIAQMLFSTGLLLAAATTMVLGGYLLGGVFMIAGTVLGLISVDGD